MQLVERSEAVEFSSTPRIIGDSPAMQKLLEKVERIGPMGIRVLIRGENRRERPMKLRLERLIMNRCVQALLVAGVLWPTLSFAQAVFIDSPPEGETVTGPTVTVRMSVADFQLGEDGRIRIAIDGIFVTETERLRVTLAVPSGTHEIEARLVDRRSKPLGAIPDTVKFTMADPSM